MYEKLQDAKRRLDELSANRTLREQQLELYRFQADEIDEAELDAGEYEELKARASVLTNLEKLKKDAGAAHAALYEADGSVLERLKMMAGVSPSWRMLDHEPRSRSPRRCATRRSSWRKRRSTCRATSTSSTSTRPSWPR